MRTFPIQGKTSKASATKAAKEQQAPTRARDSAVEFREKVESFKEQQTVKKDKLQISPRAKEKQKVIDFQDSEMQKISAKVGSEATAKNGDEKVSPVLSVQVKEIAEVGVGENNPEDPVTHEKLKKLLDNGAINFNPKEREVLQKILN